MTSVKKSPTSGSAYLFLTQSYAATQQRIGAQGTSLVLYYLLSPANQNTFSQSPSSQPVYYISNDYTPMFEMPYWRATLQGGLGAWKSNKSVQEHSGEVYGGLPGLAFDVGGFYTDDRGFRERNADNKIYSVAGLIKWEPTPQHSFLASYTYADAKNGDISNLNDFRYNNLPFLRDANHARLYEIGYVYRFNPNANFLFYYNYSANDVFRVKNITPASGQAELTLPPISLVPGVSRVDSGNATFDVTNYFSLLTPHELHNAQVQQQLIVGDHTLLGGFDYFTGHLKFRQQSLSQGLIKNYNNLTSTLFFFGNPVATFANPYTVPVNFPFSFSSNQAFRPPDRSYSFYLMDYWNIRRDLLLELGLFKDIAKSSRLGFAEPIYNNKWSPRLGINYQVNNAHTLRLALQENVNTHFLLSPLTTSLVPPEIASFPWQINVEDGSQIREAGTAWEAQWNTKTFSVLRLDALRVSRPAYETDFDGNPFRSNFMWKRYQASFTVNRILGQYFGLSLGALAKKTDPTWIGFNDFKEYNSFAKLVFWHPSGWWAWINPFLVKQDLTDRGDNLFGLLNAQVGYQFPGKWGLAALEVTNLLNRHFFYDKDPPSGLDVIFPQRRIMFKLALFF